MKIYLAGSCGNEQRTMMVNIGKALRAEGHKVYCPFELQIPNAWDMSQEAWAHMVFQEDRKSILECDAMVSISQGRQSTAGTNWEQGFAFGNDIPVHVVQITDAPTSLMTYWGCDSFHVATPKTVIDVVLDILRDAENGFTDRDCVPVLT